MASQRELLQQTIDKSKRLLAELELQIAGFGDLYAPPHMKVDRDDTKEKIADLERQLAALPPDAPAPAGNYARAARFEKNVEKAMNTLDELNNELSNETRTVEKNRIKDNIEMIKTQYISALNMYLKMGGDSDKYPPDLD
jgi:hypothetical protein